MTYSAAMVREWVSHNIVIVVIVVVVVVVVIIVTAIIVIVTVIIVIVIVIFLSTGNDYCWLPYVWYKFKCSTSLPPII